MYFACFQNMSIKVTPNFEKYGKCLKIFANTNSKCTCIREILPYVRGMKVVLGPCIYRKLYVSSRVTPCRYLEFYVTFLVDLLFCARWYNYWYFKTNMAVQSYYKDTGEKTLERNFNFVFTFLYTIPYTQ